MIGDNFKLDIEGAMNAGLNAIWVNRKGDKKSFKNQIKEINESLVRL